LFEAASAMAVSEKRKQYANYNAGVCLTVIGDTFGQQGQLEKAEESLKRAVRYCPGFVLAQKSYGRALFYGGNNSKAEFHLRQALKLLNKNKANATILMLDADVQNDRSRKVTPGKLAEIGFQANFQTTNTFLVGTKEFEDVFSDEIICHCLNKYWKKDADKQWTAAEISALRTKPKFSEALENFVDNYRTNNPVTFESFGKAEFGRKMAEEITVEEFNVIAPFRRMIEKLKAIIA
jgi:tetratricopeptide (TPR) repeat protein